MVDVGAPMWVSASTPSPGLFREKEPMSFLAREGLELLLVPVGCPLLWPCPLLGLSGCA
jgi:hypothetical protein